MSFLLTLMFPWNQIYTYNEDGPTIENEQFLERIYWNGSKRSTDIQDGSIYLYNVTFNDSGTYRCFFNRILFFDNYRHNDIISKVVHLTVVAKGTMKSTAVLYSYCISL